MSEIPEDILRAAAEAHASFARSSDTRNLGQIIAEVILAERERCAGFAADVMKDNDTGSGFDSRSAHSAAWRIHNAILHPDTLIDEAKLRRSQALDELGALDGEELA